MSSRRHLVNRSSRPTAANETPARRQDARRPAAVLPPYQPLQCPLTANAKDELENLGSNLNNSKYHQSLKDGIKFLSSAVEDTSEMLDDLKKKLHQLVKRREKDGGEKTDFEETIENNISRIEEKLEEYIVEGEKAVRELIDYEFQHNQRAEVIQSIVTKIVAAPAPAARERTRREPRSRNSDAGDDENVDDEESDQDDQSIPVLKPIELLKQAQNERRAIYEAQSLRDRYTGSNDYVGFRTISHIAQHGEDTPIPSARNWFREGGDDSPEPQQNNNGDDSDDDLVIQSATVNTKCPLTMVDLTEPYSNPNCIHVYEKTSLLEYIQSTGTSYSRGRAGQTGSKQVKCVVSGCDVMIRADDCFTDPLISRKVKRALAEQKRLEEDEDSEDEDVPPGSQRNKPAEIYDEEDNRETKTGRTNARVKAERMSRGVSLGRALSTPAGHTVDEGMADIEDQTGDLDDEDEMDEDTGFAEDYEA